MCWFTEEQRLTMMRALDLCPEKYWCEMTSELQRGGAELAIWVLVNAPSQIEPALRLILEVTAPFRTAAAKTDVSISFDQHAEGRLIHWNHIEPAEVRSGVPLLPLGYEPTELSIDPSESVYLTLRPSRPMAGS